NLQARQSQAVIHSLFAAPQKAGLHPAAASQNKPGTNVPIKRVAPVANEYNRAKLRLCAAKQLPSKLS
ncbi:hypothetical protein OFB47_29705, partial [Escherichia coli]|nr:hypothetical protein [Escherichia coli]